MPFKSKQESVKAAAAAEEIKRAKNKWQERKAAEQEETSKLLVRRGEADPTDDDDDGELTTSIELKSWSDPSNVGNLSIREKSGLAILIFSCIVFSWVFSFSVSVCGSSSFGSTQYQQELTMCKTTWSTLAAVLPDTGANGATGLQQQQVESLTNRMGHLEQVNQVLQLRLIDEQTRAKAYVNQMQISGLERESMVRELNDLKEATLHDADGIESLSTKCAAQTSDLKEQLQRCDKKQKRLHGEIQSLVLRVGDATSECDSVRNTLSDTQRKYDELLRKESVCSVADGKRGESSTKRKKPRGGEMKRNPFARFFNMKDAMKS
jgi:hypothetical protein